ncbi:MAG: hypothetical protein EOP05_04530 [Proteobacteria bacterium]|nr:MAG: hypothetical protein EOP05_04530 [Pseudomonadota bacterium]
MRKQKFILIGAACLALVLLAAAASHVGAAWLSERSTLAAFQKADSDWQERRQHFDSKLKVDLELLTENPIFMDLARIRNAEPLFRNHMTWDGDKTGSAPEGEEFDQEQQIKAFSERHQKDSATFNAKSFDAILEDPDLEKLKLNWSDELMTFDHFSLATHPSHEQALSKVASLNGTGRVAVAASLPYPNYSFLQAVATFRFAQLAKQGKIEDAAKFYRHLTYLVYSSHTLAGSMVAVSMLKRESSFAEALTNSLGEYPIALIENERLQALKSLSWFWGGIYQKGFLANRAAGLEDFFNRDTGACAAASEIFTSTSGVASLFETTAPLEQDFSANFKRARTFEQKVLRMCGLEAYSPFTAPTVEAPDAFYPTRIPFLRRHIGSTLITLPGMNSFAFYENLERESEHREPAAQ